MQISQFLNFNWAGIGFCLGMLALVVGAGFASNGLRRPSCGDDQGPRPEPEQPHELPPQPSHPQPHPHARHLIDFDSSIFTVRENGTIEAQCCVPYCEAITVIAPNLRGASVARIPPQPADADWGPRPRVW